MRARFAPERCREHSTDFELSELAVMSALAAWLRRWQPIAIHSAIRTGARPEAVAGALGDSVEVTFDRWQEWAQVQRDFIVGGRPGITAEEYEAVASHFVCLGIELPSSSTAKVSTA